MHFFEVRQYYFTITLKKVRAMLPYFCFQTVALHLELAKFNFYGHETKNRFTLFPFFRTDATFFLIAVTSKKC